jgi:hypothetical protein
MDNENRKDCVAEALAALTPEQRDLWEEAVTQVICEELDRLLAEGRARLLRAEESIDVDEG